MRVSQVREANLGLCIVIRYHNPMLSLRQLAAALHAQLLPPDVPHAPTLTRVSHTRDANADSLVFTENETTLCDALASAAGAVLTTPQLASSLKSPSKPLLVTSQPRLAFARAAQIFRAANSSSGIHPTAILGADTRIGPDVSLGPYAVIGDRVVIGERTHIGPGCVIADNVRIGADCKIYPRVVIYAGVELGNHVIIHAGCILGSDGFGYVRDSETGAYTQFPQQGTLSIEDDVEIGANTTIDRGALEKTRIARGTKLDNLVHIGHNVRIGRNVVIAAQTGISGSSTVEDGAILGGQVGIGEHAEVGPNVILGGGAGVLSKKKLRGPGIVFWGRPAQPLREYLKGLATLARLSRRTKE